ncbi:hypothetical protein [Streptomyces xanthophaeus]|uniref:hypothetical protein n=1 Tax=Streptomyces xanthophaeus TaxID=67385 RepID=UPI00371A3CE9
MSYSFYLMRFVDGEVAALDAERFLRVIGPYVTARDPELGFVQLRAEDGGRADVYFRAHPQDGLTHVTFTHVGVGAVFGLLARLTAELSASFAPQDDVTLILDEDARPHLPPPLRRDAVVVAPTGEAFLAVLGRD